MIIFDSDRYLARNKRSNNKLDIREEDYDYDKTENELIELLNVEGSINNVDYHITSGIKNDILQVIEL